MKKLVAGLSLTTALFASSTLYLAYRLYAAAPGPASEPLAAVQAASGGPGLPTASSPAGAPPGSSTKGATAATPVAAASGPAAPSPAGKRVESKSVEAQRATMLPFAKQYLERLDDPARRAALLDETRSNLHRQYEPLRQKLKLDDATFDQLLTVLAEQQIQPQEKYFRCLVDTDCDLANFGRNGNVVDDRSGELLSLLGSDAMNELKNYSNTLNERETVVQLRGRLDDANNLRDAQAEQLVAALSDVRAQFQKDAAQRGTTMNGWGTPQLGMLYYSGDSSSLDQRFSEAAQYSQRLRTRAAAVLSPQQLAAFVQIQEELLAAMRASMLPPG